MLIMRGVSFQWDRVVLYGLKYNDKSMLEDLGKVFRVKTLGRLLQYKAEYCLNRSKHN